MEESQSTGPIYVSIMTNIHNLAHNQYMTTLFLKIKVSQFIDEPTAAVVEEAASWEPTARQPPRDRAAPPVRILAPGRPPPHLAAVPRG
jgi:hypothetical protein